jgi:hypothetical protein
MILASRFEREQTGFWDFWAGVSLSSWSWVVVDRNHPDQQKCLFLRGVFGAVCTLLWRGNLGDGPIMPLKPSKSLCFRGILDIGLGACFEGVRIIFPGVLMVNNEICRCGFVSFFVNDLVTVLVHSDRLWTRRRAESSYPRRPFSLLRTSRQLGET